MHFWLRLINYQTYHIWVFYKMDPVFFIKSTKIGVFYQYGYTDITTFRDPCIMTKLSFGKFVRMTRMERWKGGGREWWITDSLLSNRRRQEPLASYAMSYPGTEHRGEAGGWRGFSSDPQCAPLMMSWSRIHLLIISQPTRQKASRIEHWHQSVWKNMILLQDKTQLNKKKTDCFKEINFCFYRLGLDHTNGGGNSALMSLNLT